MNLLKIVLLKKKIKPKTDVKIYTKHKRYANVEVSSIKNILFGEFYF